MSGDGADARQIDVVQVAGAYRWVIGSLGIAYLAQGFAMQMDAGEFSALTIPAMLVSLAAYASMLYFVYRLRVGMGDRAAWMWVIAMFVPCANIIVLLVLSRSASAFFRERDISVGFLGPDMTEVLEFVEEQEDAEFAEDLEQP